ncbi:MAG: hypothetical protein JST08_02455 [Actinobacteria bacterium]|nr:hypothetical protein [Actinomycetota bacterium]
MGVVVVYDAYSRLGDLLGEGIRRARARQTRLEVIAVVSPLRSLLIGYGLANAAMLQETHEYELSWELDRRVSSVPADVPVRSRILRAGRRRVRREVAALMPAEVIGLRLARSPRPWG